MKRLLLITLTSLSIHAIAQTNTFPSNGNVGIGTTDPTDKLNIHGPFLQTGIYEVPGIYFSTTNGTYSWGVAQISPFIASNNGRTGGYPGGLAFKTKTPDALPTSFPTTKMVIDANGNVGIGMTNPIDRLEISGGNIIVNRPTNKVDRNGISELSAFEINNSFAPGQTGYVKVFYPSYNNLLFGADYDGNIGGVQPNIQFGQKNTPFLTVVNNGNYTGNVGIGTQNPAYKLDVLGTIRAKEVLVNLDGGADFVFEKGYQLLPIEHVANYVQENKHLPDIPSATDMVKNGVSMGDMQVKLLQKVEELTLYVIELKKEIELLKKQPIN